MQKLFTVNNNKVLTELFIALTTNSYQHILSTTDNSTAGGITCPVGALYQGAQHLWSFLFMFPCFPSIPPASASRTTMRAQTMQETIAFDEVPVNDGGMMMATMLPTLGCLCVQSAEYTLLHASSEWGNVRSDHPVNVVIG